MTLNEQMGTVSEVQKVVFDWGFHVNFKLILLDNSILFRLDGSHFLKLLSTNITYQLVLFLIKHLVT
jgi:hypothetical protein